MAVGACLVAVETNVQLENGAWSARDVAVMFGERLEEGISCNGRGGGKIATGGGGGE